MIDRSTISYYDAHAEEYAEKTKYVYMFDVRSVFLKYLDPAGRILDAGCGGGRDMRIFMENGFTVDGFDASPEMCRVASAWTGEPVQCCDFESYVPRFTYTGIWACASLLHCTEEGFFAFFRRYKEFLGSSGVIYFSMKTGIEDGYDGEGRWYLGFNDRRLQRILTENPDLRRVKYWKTADNLHRDLTWANVILQKEF
jgi:SAM-dependent methyltransferase